jgi:hypothetical protein
MHAISVIKADGRRATFDLYNEEATYRRAGASPSLDKKTAQHIATLAYEGISIKEIYKLTLAAVAADTAHPEIKHRYRLKESLMLLGPAGFNFESYVGEVLARNGFDVVSIRSKVKGRCVEHEVDLIATDGGNTVMVECKFHNYSGTFTGLKQAMYTHDRFIDIAKEELNISKWKCSSEIHVFLMMPSICPVHWAASTCMALLTRRRTRAINRAKGGYIRSQY